MDTTTLSLDTGVAHPALKNAPTSLREALTRIVNYGEQHTFACNGYRAGELRCPIGLFFTEAQLDHIESLRNEENASLNEYNVLELADAIGAHNIEAMTGMTPLQANVIQYISDIQDQETLLQNIREILDGTRSELLTVEFKL